MENKVSIDLEEYIELRKSDMILDNLVCLILDNSRLSYDKKDLLMENELKIFDYLKIHYPETIESTILNLQEKGEK